MKFRVNEGQQIPQVQGVPGGARRVMLKAGDEVDGPDWWAREFAGRMTPLDENGNPVDLQMIEARSQDLATAKAHERIALLREMSERNPSLAEALKPELEKAEKDAQAAQEEFAKRIAERRQRDATRQESRRNPPIQAGPPGQTGRAPARQAVPATQVSNAGEPQEQPTEEQPES
jgi:hypothetical protein